jgi:hypothetical protein
VRGPAPRGPLWRRPDAREPEPIRVRRLNSRWSRCRWETGCSRCTATRQYCKNRYWSLRRQPYSAILILTEWPLQERRAAWSGRWGGSFGWCACIGTLNGRLGSQIARGAARRKRNGPLSLTLSPLPAERDGEREEREARAGLGLSPRPSPRLAGRGRGRGWEVRFMERIHPLARVHWDPEPRVEGMLLRPRTGALRGQRFMKSLHPLARVHWDPEPRRRAKGRWPMANGEKRQRTGAVQDLAEFGRFMDGPPCGLAPK